MSYLKTGQISLKSDCKFGILDLDLDHLPMANSVSVKIGATILYFRQKVANNVTIKPTREKFYRYI